MSSYKIEDINSMSGFTGLKESDKLRKLANEIHCPCIYMYAEESSDHITHTHYERVGEQGDGNPFPPDTTYRFNRVLIYYLEETRKIVTFVGKTLDEAKAAVESAKINPQLIRGMKVVCSPHESSSVVYHKTFKDATDLLNKRLLSLGAFDLKSVEVFQEGQNGSEDIQAWSEQEARHNWIKTKAPKGAVIDDQKMVSAVKPGIFGIGKKPGTWKFRWYTPYVVTQKYTFPAKIIVLVVDSGDIDAEPIVKTQPMNISAEDYLAKPCSLKIRPYSDYQKDQIVILTFDDIEHGLLLPAGTLAKVAEVTPDHTIWVELMYSQKYHPDFIKGLQGKKGFREGDIDIYDENDNIYINLGDWVPIRRSNDGHGWYLPESGKYYLRIRLKTEEILEGNMESWSHSSNGYCTSVRVMNHDILAEEIDNIIYKRIDTPLE